MNRRAETFGVVSSATLRFQFEAGQPQFALLKRAAILFDHIIFHQFNDDWTHLFRPSSAGAYFAELVTRDPDERTVLSKSKDFRRIFLHSWDVIDLAGLYSFLDDVDDRNPWPTWPEGTPGLPPGLRVPMMRNSAQVVSMHRKIARERTREALGLLGLPLPRAWWRLTQEVRHGVLDDLLVLQAITRTQSNSVGLFAPAHAELVEAAHGRLPPETRTVTLLTELKRLATADFASLSWAEILQLRRNGFLHDFRGRLREIAHAEAMGQGTLATALTSDMWSLVGDARPDLPRTYMNALLSNLPFVPLPVNPAGIAVSLSDIGKTRKVSQKHGWLFFLYEGKLASKGLAGRSEGDSNKFRRHWEW